MLRDAELIDIGGRKISSAFLRDAEPELIADELGVTVDALIEWARGPGLPLGLPWAERSVVYGVWERDYEYDKLIGLYWNRADAETKAGENAAPAGAMWPDTRGLWTVEAATIR